ncbi:WXG100 family type VII secretion target [Microbacterium sp. Marseille-Q6965]|uniref:WXG100 family type VII secretion target n=1 Tax=Microbacterium sp. Marseille-Q6965 TaxID=2965072 RepID=UPI0021B8009A|nr:hypothetical protein [Microbacterium sp. Marseille-Q6965]
MSDLLVTEDGDDGRYLHDALQGEWSGGQAIDALSFYPGPGQAAASIAAFGTGDWADGITYGLSSAVSTAALIADPLGTLLSSAASFLMEYMWPLPDFLDWLAGDPELVASLGQSWENIGAHIDGYVQDLTSQVEQALASWAGPAAEAYRRQMEVVVAHVEALAGAAGATGSGLRVASTAVEIIRTIVRELIADLVGRLIAYCVQLGATLGAALPVVIGQATIAISSTVTDCSRYIDELVACIRTGADAGKGLADALSTVLKGVTALASGADQGGDEYGW